MFKDEINTASLLEQYSSGTTNAKESEMLKIPVIKGQSLIGDIPVIIGSMPVKHMLDRHEIPYLDALRETGYQRLPSMTRVKKLAADLRAGHADIPTSVLINIRDKEITEYLIEEDGMLFLLIPLDSKIKFYIVDGQHRILAFKQLYDENFDKWGDYQVQFVAMLGANKELEMKQFYTVNSTAKSVRTDLAYNILAKLSDDDQHIHDTLIMSGTTWKVEGQKLADLLHKKSNVWKNKIRLANADKLGTVLPIASLVNSMAPILKSKFFGNMSINDQYEILEAYWMGIKAACPEAFGDDYKDYALQKGLGVAVLNDLLGDVIEVLRSQGKSVTDIKAYTALTKPMLSGLSAANADGKEVSGAEFWLSGKHGGAAGAFSSSAGKKLLSAKLKMHLPKITY